MGCYWVFNFFVHLRYIFIVMVTVEIKDNSKQAKKFLEYIKTLPFVKVKEEKAKPKQKEHPVSKNVPNVETLRIFKENDKAKGKGLKRHNNIDDLIKELNS